MKVKERRVSVKENRVAFGESREEVRARAKVNYHLIFSDILNKKYPEKKKECRRIMEKKELSVLDVIQLNKIIFGPVDKETEEFNQSHRSYTVSSIFQILDFQKKNKLNNTQVALYFKLSRHTVAKWKKKYLIN
ncbi:helix-turn-helix domain-containing protein [Chryseobacterium nematophagum]|uniref:helix-turn-helix domain-containing protein n=1 Tax=Chryseobacterium nematophagum TaxID=2305228 RepID=UPI001E46A384|nr:helix-turn-helix domain-containing protein [Chryseobacterium nematophagum]